MMAHQPQWQAIVAMDDQRGIGHGGTLPWHLPEDFRWFKEKTLGTAVVMGRKTFVSIGRPLPRRLNIILSRQADPSDFPCPVVRSLEAITDDLLDGHPVMVIGGAEVYRLALPRCTDLWISHVAGTFPADTFFPPYEEAFRPVATILQSSLFRVVHWQRIQHPDSTAG